MKTWLHGIALALVWGVLAGAVFGLAGVWVEGYLPLGLVLLCARTLESAIRVYAALALLGGVSGLLVWELLRRTGARPRRLAEPHLRLVFAAFVSLPTWAGVALHDRWMLPEGAARAIATLAILASLHAAILLSWHRLAGTPEGHRGRRLEIAAGLCIVLVAVLAGARWGLASIRGSADRPNLLLVVLDTVRADRLSSYGYPRPTSPEIDAFAADAIRFTDFYSTSSWTLPSHASLFTGLYPAAHGATQTNLELARGHTTLAELLLEDGFQTWAACGNPFLGEGTGFSQGFERFQRTWSTRAEPLAGIHPAVSAFASFLEGSERNRPFFAFINLMEAHAPYTPPPDLERRFLRTRLGVVEADRIVRKRWTEHFAGDAFSERELAVLSDLYDGEVALGSRVFGELIELLRRDGRFENTWVVLTSDHGEHFGEHGLVQHMFTLYNTAVRIPLFIRPPGGVGGPRTREGPAQLVDLFAALLVALDVARPAAADHGRDLLSSGFRREAVFSEYDYPSQALGLFRPVELTRSRVRINPHRRSLRALQLRGSRLIWSSDGRHELYDLASDPGETRNLYDPDAPSPVAVEMLAEIERLAREYGRMASGSAGRGAAVDDETEDALRALGYVR